MHAMLVIPTVQSCDTKGPLIVDTPNKGHNRNNLFINAPHFQGLKCSFIFPYY